MDPDSTASHVGTPVEEGRRVARATLSMSSLTVLSRVLGLARDIAQAAVLGTGTAADAFTLAFIIPNTLRRLFGESTVSAAFVPTYTGFLLGGDTARSSRLGSGAINATAACLAVLVTLGMVFSPLLARLFGPGFSAVPGKLELSTGLLRLLFPYVLFVGTGAVVMGILNSSRHFVTPALGPVLFNVSALGGLFGLASAWRQGSPVWGYSVGVLFGGFLQLAIQLPALRRTGFAYRLTPGFGDRDLAGVARLALPALFGLMVAEVNVMVDQVMASMLDPGSVAALSYGNRVMQFPLGVFAVALATALLPTLSRQAVLGRLAEARVTLGYATLGLALLMLPASIYTAAFGREIVTVLMARGAFDAESVELTTASLVFFSAGLVFFGATKITAPVFYALKDTATPFRIGMISMGINIPLNITLSLAFRASGFSRPVGGIALATTLSSAANLLLLRLALRRRTGRCRGAPPRAWLAMLPATAASAAAAVLLRGWVSASVARSLFNGLTSLLAAGVACFALQFVVFAAAGGRTAAVAWRLLTKRGPDGP